MYDIYFVLISSYNLHLQNRIQNHGTDAHLIIISFKKHFEWKFSIGGLDIDYSVGVDAI